MKSKQITARYLQAHGACSVAKSEAKSIAKAFPKTKRPTVKWFVNNMSYRASWVANYLLSTAGKAYVDAMFGPEEDENQRRYYDDEISWTKYVNAKDKLNKRRAALVATLWLVENP